MTATNVVIQNIALSYDGGKTQVLKDINLDIETGEFFALLGPSGSGKSTLLRLIAGFNFAQAGSIHIGGEDISRVPPHLRNVGLVFQSYALWPHMTVADNVAFGLVERKWAKADIARKVNQMLDLVGLADFAQRRPNQLSGGQQQRVALARTLAIEPRVLLLDEPLSNLDAKLRVQMREELKRLQRKLGITTIFVTHDQEEALTTCDRIAVMDGGVIQQVGRPDQLYDDPVNRFVANFIGTVNLVPVCVSDDAAATTAVTKNSRSVRVTSSVFGTITVPAAPAVAAGSAAARGSMAGAEMAGSAGDLAVRPLAMHLAARGEAARPDDIVVEGRVIDHEFMGEYVRYRVSTGETTLTVDQSHRAHTPLFAPETPVRIAVSPRDFRFLPA